MERLIVVAALVLAGEAGAQSLTPDQERRMRQEITTETRTRIAQEMVSGYHCEDPDPQKFLRNCQALLANMIDLIQCTQIRDSELRLICFDIGATRAIRISEE